MMRRTALFCMTSLFLLGLALPGSAQPVYKDWQQFIPAFAKEVKEKPDSMNGYWAAALTADQNVSSPSRAAS